MNRKTTLYPLLFLLLLPIIISPVQGANEIDLSAFPSLVSDKLNISLFAGGILCGIFLELMVLLPVTLITRRRNTTGFVPELVFGLSVVGFNVAVGWFPSWFLLVFTMLIAFMFSSRMRNLVTGKR